MALDLETLPVSEGELVGTTASTEYMEDLATGHVNDGGLVKYDEVGGAIFDPHPF